MERRHFLRLSLLTPAAAAAASVVAAPASAAVQNEAGHSFGFAADGSAFLLDGKPFQIRSGEMHPARIPVEYWPHRIRMAKAMGLNTIALYVMWNYIEERPGVYDFVTGRRDFEAFIRICQAEGMWVLLRPGPYVCGEWTLGGIPPYLLRYPDIQLRVSSQTDPHYMAAVARYFAELVPRVKPLMVANGGPVLMIQIENEYGSYGSDQAYVEEIRQLWIDGGVPGPFYTEDGLYQVDTYHTNVPGGAIALSGGDAGQIAQARTTFPAVPSMAGEVYPGWLTHWGDAAFGGVGTDISGTLTGLMDGGQSFNLYLAHGGTSFGFFAGANANNDGSGYQPDITSYDYWAPITEQGVATAKYTEYRELIAGYLPTALPPVPAPIPTIVRSAGPALTPKPFASLWDNLPRPVPGSTAGPQTMEALGQNDGFLLYRASVQGYAGGTLAVGAVHDYATVFVDGAYQGGFSRPALPDAVSQQLNVTTGDQLALATPGQAGTAGTAELDIFTEGMGRINYGHGLVDRKGIIGTVTLNGRVVTAWRTFLLPMDSGFIGRLRPVISDPARPGQFFRCEVELDSSGDTYVDVSNWTKGVVWVNGNNLGRYWELGPQHRLYCPASWLRRGANEIIIFDHHQTEPKPIAFSSTLG